MKGDVCRFIIALGLLAGCVGFASAGQTSHNHHIVLRKVSEPQSKDWLRQHKSSSKTDWLRTHKTTTRRQTDWLKPRTSTRKGRTYVYRNHRRYTQSEWESIIRNSRRRRNHHHDSIFTRRHDNGLHRGWDIGRGNPHRIGFKNHRGGRDDQGEDNGNGKGHGHGNGKGNGHGNGKGHGKGKD